MPEYLWTGQSSCYDSNGTVVPCRESGQDGEFRTGMPWPEERFSVNGELVLDNLTGLQWLKNANIGEFPVTWQEALDYAAWMNRENIAGHADWRMPNRRELRSLMALRRENRHCLQAILLKMSGMSTGLQPAASLNLIGPGPYISIKEPPASDSSWKKAFISGRWLRK